MIEAIKKRIGETGEVLDAGIAYLERNNKEVADWNIPVVSKFAEAVGTPALMGARAAVAKMTSGDGKYYSPEVRDERYFSKAALQELGKNVNALNGRTAGRTGGLDGAVQLGLHNTIGGFSVRDGAVTDVFDINESYEDVPGVMTKITRAVLPTSNAPDAGKIRTRIPLDRLGVQQDAGGGNAGQGSETAVSETAVAEPVPQDGPRIVINPTVFEDEKDALCVAWNEAFRIVMEYMDFSPVSEPTDEQRRFFSDTAYANDELQLRRTILARICTFDTSVKNPSDEQIQEAVEFLQDVLDSGVAQDDSEIRMVQRIEHVLSRIPVRQGRRPVEEPAPSNGPANADAGGGKSDAPVGMVRVGTDIQGKPIYRPENSTGRDIQGNWKTNDGGLVSPDGTQLKPGITVPEGSGVFTDIFGNLNTTTGTLDGRPPNPYGTIDGRPPNPYGTIDGKPRRFRLEENSRPRRSGFVHWQT